VLLRCSDIENSWESSALARSSACLILSFDAKVSSSGVFELVAEDRSAVRYDS